MKKTLICILAVLGIYSMDCYAGPSTKEFKTECDSLKTLLIQRTNVKAVVSLKEVTVNGSVISFNFSEQLGDWPWYSDDVKWFREELHELLPAKYAKYKIGEVKCNGTSLYRYVTPELSNTGKPVHSDYKVSDHRNAVAPLVRCMEKESFEKGLSGRTIALWQSHGRYFEQSLDRWEWQRATIFETVEDLYTQSYVVPFLVPMLENAGAVVMLPRERDYSSYESVADNDPSWNGSELYYEMGEWTDAGTGFCDSQETYGNLDNPFTMGTARMTPQKAGSKDMACWYAEMPERGNYAVYVSYKTLENSTDCAHYTVHHLGGDTHFTVNQTMGGGMWVYLGSFDLPAGRSEVVTLDATVPAGHKAEKDKVVTADAVKIGGGMGNIARKVNGTADSTAVTSGMPRFTEAARYWLQWSGFDEKVWNLNDQKHDYRDDFMCRGPWVENLTGGSRVNKDEEGKGIPVDLSFAFHTDAGTFRGDTIVGTLAIYTRLKDNKDKYTDGSDRQAAREYTSLVQSQIVSDIQAHFAPEWKRRQTWDRSYSESRMPNVPAMLLELLSHQNFADMKYGLDPDFRFCVSRAIYKGMLKFLSDRYGCPYVVQPLPVNSFSATYSRADNGDLEHATDSTITVCLRWKPTVDDLEPTAVASKYMVFSRRDDGGWDNGTVAKTETIDSTVCCKVEMPLGHVYSWKVVAMNDGGSSFPSCVMSAGVPADALSADRKSFAKGLVIAIDNFNRVGAPTFYDSDEYAGFDNRVDGGIGYMSDASFIGDMYEWHRIEPWQDDDCPGFGASYVDYADKVIAGNTFDWSYRHGRMIFKEDRAFCSATAEAFSHDPGLANGSKVMDLICGKQVTTICGTAQYGYKYQVFTPALQKAITDYTSNGGNVLISGSYIATDAWSYVYPIKIDKEAQKATCSFCENVLGYKWRTNFGSHNGSVHCVGGFNFMMSRAPVRFNSDLRRDMYRVESPDGIIPASKNGSTILRYYDSNVPAGVLFYGNGYKVISMGFPIESVIDEDARQNLIGSALESLW